MVQSNSVNTDAKGAIESVRGVRIKQVSVKRGPSLIMTSFSFSSTGRTLRATKQPHALFNSTLLGSHG